MREFIQFATTYKLSGHPLYELCDHNYKVGIIQGGCTAANIKPISSFFIPKHMQVARDLHRQDVAQVWLIVKLLYCGSDPNCSPLGLLPTNVPVAPKQGSWRVSQFGRPEGIPTSTSQGAAEREQQLHATDGPSGKAVESLAGNCLLAQMHMAEGIV